MIRFELPVAGRAEIEVFDLRGRRVRTLFQGELSSGAHLAEWDRRDTEGRPVPAGVYLYRLIANGLRAEKKMVLVP